MNRAVTIVYICAVICLIAGLVGLVRGSGGAGTGSLVAAGVLCAVGLTLSNTQKKRS